MKEIAKMKHGMILFLRVSFLSISKGLCLFKSLSVECKTFLMKKNIYLCICVPMDIWTYLMLLNINIYRRIFKQTHDVFVVAKTLADYRHKRIK